MLIRNGIFNDRCIYGKLLRCRLFPPGVGEGDQNCQSIKYTRWPGIYLCKPLIAGDSGAACGIITPSRQISLMTFKARNTAAGKGTPVWEKLKHIATVINSISIFVYSQICMQILSISFQQMNLKVRSVMWRECNDQALPMSNTSRDMWTENSGAF